MDDDNLGLPVYNMARSEYAEGDKPIGYATDKKTAARLIRAETGDSAYRAADVFYSASLNAYFAEE